MHGKYYSKYITTTGTDEDLVATIKATLGLNSLMIKKLTMISAVDFNVNINNNGASDSYLDPDAKYYVFTNLDDILISSLVVAESGVAIFVSIIF